jgi:RimJ/RimL family protein N-acetyltransferase
MIEWESHCRWLATVLGAPDRVLLIGESLGSPVGVVRFDLKGEEAEISIYLVPGAHPPGRGGQLLRSAERWLSENRPQVNCVTAQVLGPNERSARMFLGAGYRKDAAQYSKRLS